MNYNNKAWLLLIPALVVMATTAFIPLITVINYSLHYIFSGAIPEFVGFSNYVEVLRDPKFLGTLGRQLVFSFAILAVEIPLGIMIALSLPSKGVGVGISLVLLGIPLLIPYNVVGIVWRLFSSSNIGFIPEVLSWIDYSYNVSLHAMDATITLFILV
jgi:glycerol transport system permease protein